MLEMCIRQADKHTMLHYDSIATKGNYFFTRSRECSTDISRISDRQCPQVLMNEKEDTTFLVFFRQDAVIAFLAFHESFSEDSMTSELWMSTYVLLKVFPYADFRFRL
jgi:hypothetical protein